MRLSEKVYAATRRIPKSRVATYADIARAIGRPRAWRFVGNVLRVNRDPRTPCHRVVRSDGFLEGFGLPGGVAEKERRLRRERVILKDGKIDLVKFGITTIWMHRRFSK